MELSSTLVTVDAKKKVRVIQIWTIFNDPEYVIKRQSGLLNGKMIQQPDITIAKGKVKRTIEEQTILQYNSEVKKYLDKGYKTLQHYGVNTLSELDVQKVTSDDKTDTKGVKKPMLAKSYKDIKKVAWNKEWYCSTKLDGVRIMLFLRDGEIHTSSRGGQDYDLVTTYIRNDAGVKRLFWDNPNIVLDGELYWHGKPLSYISGLCRLETLCPEHDKLSIYCYDIVDETKSFKERLCVLRNLRAQQYTDKIVFIHHFLLSGEQTIMNKHDEFVNAGFEGLVMRDPEAVYNCGGRNTAMIKVKAFVDDEFEITGLSEGLRDEDLCFTLITKEGFPFKAKPMGTREDKEWYRNHISELIGQMGTVKHFGWTTTDHPVPNLPVLRNVRLFKDLNND